MRPLGVFFVLCGRAHGAHTFAFVARASMDVLVDLAPTFHQLQRTQASCPMRVAICDEPAAGTGPHLRAADAVLSGGARLARGAAANVRLRTTTKKARHVRLDAVQAWRAHTTYRAWACLADHLPSSLGPGGRQSASHEPGITTSHSGDASLASIARNTCATMPATPLRRYCSWATDKRERFLRRMICSRAPGPACFAAAANVCQG